MNENKRDNKENRIDGFEKFLEQKQIQSNLKKSTENSSFALSKKRERENEKEKGDSNPLKQNNNKKVFFYKDDEDSENEIKEDSSSGSEQEGLFEDYFFEKDLGGEEERFHEFYDVFENKK